eukprot:m51a1_g3101 hypothetical protein (154) ;mRNA; r:120620-121081
MKAVSRTVFGTVRLPLPRDRSPLQLLDKLLLAVLLGIGASTLVLWTLALAAHRMALLPGTEPATARHVVAEYMMGSACLVGAVATLAGASWGAHVAMFGAGMAAYAPYNGLDWAERNEPGLVVLMQASVAFAYAALAVRCLMRCTEQSGDKHV